MLTRAYCRAVASRVRARLLEFALSLPEAFEDQPWEEDTVAKVRKKIFVFLGGPALKQMTVKLVESHGHALTVEGAVAQRVRARQVRLGDRAARGRRRGRRAPAGDWIEESYRIVAPKRLVAELDGRN